MRYGRAWAGSDPRRVRGYTYLLVLFMVAALGLFAAQAGIVWHAAQQREREAELLAIGGEMARALAYYRDEAPAGTPPAPTSLEQLLQDPRYPTMHRHLRRIYRDPLTARAEWGLVRQGEFIVGIYSLSKLAPIRREGLPPELDETEAKNATSYQEWIFRPLAAGVREATKSEDTTSLPSGR